MRMAYISEEKEYQEFALRAAKYFEENENHRFYSDKDIEQGCLLAIRWGMDDDCVLLLKLDEFHEPINYQNLIKKA